MSMRWYIVHAYSNFENKVAESIKEQAAQKGLGHLFEEVLVPTEEVVELRRGKKVPSARRFFPGYVLVKMEMTDEAYHLIKNTPKVTVFLGSDNKPMPISEAFVDANAPPNPQGRPSTTHLQLGRLDRSRLRIPSARRGRPAGPFGG